MASSRIQLGSTGKGFGGGFLGSWGGGTLLLATLVIGGRPEVLQLSAWWEEGQPHSCFMRENSVEGTRSDPLKGILAISSEAGEGQASGWGEWAFGLAIVGR